MRALSSRQTIGLLAALALHVAVLLAVEHSEVQVRFNTDATAVYEALRARGIVVRNRATQPGCAGCLRLTVGTAAENDQLLQALAEIGSESSVARLSVAS